MRVFLPLFFLAALLSACFRVAGGTSETSNGDLHARVTYADGRPAASVPVLVVDDSGWMAKVSLGRSVVMDSIRTDAQGWIRLKVPTGGRCNLQVDAEDEGLFLKDVGGVIRKERAAGHDLDHLELAPFGSVEGMVRSDSVSGLRIMGSTYYARFDDGAYSFPALPEGEYRLVPMAGEDVLQDTSGSLDVSVASDSGGTGPDIVGPVVTVPYGHGVFATWPMFRKIPIEVPEGTQDSLLEFPFLVRLDSSNFDFRQSNGKDIRFSNAKGHEVPHALVSYDSVGRRAEIWVRAVYTKGKEDSLVFLWGKKDAHATSNSHGVFPDYSLVLHPDAKVNPSGGYKYNDASPGHNVGLGEAPPVKSGKIGEGLSFRPYEDAYVPTDTTLMPEWTFTLSLWVRANPSGRTMELVNMDGHWGLNILPDGSPEFFMRIDTGLQYVSYPDPRGWAALNSEDHDILDNEWHHLAAVYDGGVMRLHVDGLEVVSMSQPDGIVYATRDGVLHIGTGPMTCSCDGFTGSMDEIRLAPHAWSADRILTEYENQK